jgi:hypothetical protein
MLPGSGSMAARLQNVWINDSTARLLASGLYLLITLAFVVSSVGIFIRAD